MTPDTSHAALQICFSETLPEFKVVFLLSLQSVSYPSAPHYLNLCRQDVHPDLHIVLTEFLSSQLLDMCVSCVCVSGKYVKFIIFKVINMGEGWEEKRQLYLQ